MANTKLMKVMEYLINEQEDKARDLLHQIFIEKARAIHEEMLGDEDMEETMMGGDAGDHLKRNISEIEAEEHYNEDADHDMEEDDEDMDMDDAMADLGDDLDGDEDMDDDAMDHDMGDMDGDEDADDVEVEHHDDEDHEGHEDHEEIQDTLHDLEAAIEELKKEFEALQGEGAGEAEHMQAADHAPEEEEESVEESVEESWEENTDDLEEDYDDLDESMDLDTVVAPKGGEVGSGKFARPEANTKSPLPPSQKEGLGGAKPVVTGKGPKASGYDRQTAPTSKEITGTANRRKKSTDGMKPVSKEGDTRALINKDRSEGFGTPNTRSPIQGKVR